MSKKSNKKNDAKRAAFAAKQEQEGRNVINWIFAALVGLGVLFAVYTIISVG